jgi:hypothetical protein
MAYLHIWRYFLNKDATAMSAYDEDDFIDETDVSDDSGEDAKSTVGLSGRATISRVRL